MTDMSSASSKGGGDLTSVPPTFSYAQAAKGRPVASISAPVSKPGSVSSATSNDLTSSTTATPAIAANSTSSAISSASSAEVLSSSSISQPEEAPNNIGSKPSDPHPKSNSPSPQQQLSSQSLNNISTPSSPDFGTASTSTLQKEDDISSTPNTSSESTWDKQSQSSTAADKAAELTEKEKGKEKEKERDTSKPLVAAAIPIVNIWQQRIEAQAAKAKLNPQVSVPTLQSQPKLPAPSAVSNGHVPGPSSHVGKSGDGRNPDQGKLDSKRRGKFVGEQVGDDDKTTFGQAGERKDGMGLGRDKRKSFDVHGKLREDTPRKVGSRVKTSPDKGKEPPSISIPPPAEDPISWPTPETAQDEKKRAQEKVEKPDKEKTPTTGTRPHGKEKWMPVPYTPTVVYQTPLPGIRGRGGRSTRGGRAGINIGNGVGNGVDKGASQPLTTVANDVSERGRTESTTRQDSASLPFRTNKRPASTGPSGPNSQRKPGNSAVSDKHKEADVVAGTESEAGPPLASPISRRTSTATQTDHTHKIRQDYRQGHRGDAGTFNGHAHAVADRNERGHPHNNESHTHPRSAGPDRRADSFGRGSEYFRDTGSFPGPRERGEGGTERIRGGYRGSRGNSNGYANGQHSNHGYSNGHHQNSSTYPYPKSPSPYQGSQPQAQQSGQYNHSQQQSRNYRNGPRSQSVPTPIVYNGYGQGMVGGPQQLSAIQTSISNLYDYSGVPLGAVPYSPYLQQYSDFIKALVEQL
jgi:la-related protein 1